MKKDKIFGRFMKYSAAIMSTAMVMTYAGAMFLPADIQAAVTEPLKANLVTNNYTRAAGNAIDYNAASTYVVGGFEFSNTTDIAYISGLHVNFKFSRSIQYGTQKVKETNEYFEILNLNSSGTGFAQTLDDKDENQKNRVYYTEYVANNTTAEGTAVTSYNGYISETKVPSDRYIATLNDSQKKDYGFLLQADDANGAYGQYTKPFVIVFHNLKSDIKISYDIAEGNAFNVVGTDFKTVRAFEAGELTASETNIEVKKATVTFDATGGTDINGDGKIEGNEENYTYTFNDKMPVGTLSSDRKKSSITINGDKMTDAQIPAIKNAWDFPEFFDTEALDDLRFAGWYTNKTGELDDANKLTSNTKLVTDVTYYPRWVKRDIKIEWNDGYKNIAIQHGGESSTYATHYATMHFTLNVDGKEYNTENVPADAAELKDFEKKLDSVSFKQNIFGDACKKNAGVVKNGKTYRIADFPETYYSGEHKFQAAGIYSGVSLVKLEYLSPEHASTEDAVIVVPGDVNLTASLTISDVSIMAEILRGRKSDAENYMGPLSDMNCSGGLTVSDVSIAAEMLRERLPYSNAWA